ncbi:hypothetical protein [Scytonema sp. PCC 10023]
MKNAHFNVFFTWFSSRRCQKHPHYLTCLARVFEREADINEPSGTPYG